MSVNRPIKRPFYSLVPRPVHAIRETRGGLTCLTGDVTSEIAEDDWERGWALLCNDGLTHTDNAPALLYSENFRIDSFHFLCEFSFDEVLH